jgi:hypothetical protein
MDSELELSEVFRLGEAAGEEDIVREVGDQLAAQWLRVSRFRKVQALTSRSLRVQSSPGTALRAGQAQAALGSYKSSNGVVPVIGGAD